MLEWLIVGELLIGLVLALADTSMLNRTGLPHVYLYGAVALFVVLWPLVLIFMVNGFIKGLRGQI